MGKKVYAADCETDPFFYDRVPKPFIWGLYNGKDYRTFDNTASFVDAIINLDVIVYAHNGGKFDWIYLLPFVKSTKAQVINGRIVSMKIGRAELRDSYSIIPAALRELGAKKDIDYYKLEKSIRHKYMPEIEEYLFYDCKVLWEAVTAYRNIAGKNKTIASNALAFAKKLGIDPGKTNHRFDRKFRFFYFGGRCECFRPGTHKDISILDIHSAYPFAMSHDHATGTRFVMRDNFGDMTREEIQRSFISVECTSAGAFPIRTKTGLIFPHEYNRFDITGWEYVVAKEFGLIKDEKIITVFTTPDTITFKPYINHWFAFKASYSAKDKDGKRIDPKNYAIGKYMQNSLYGKLAQDIQRYFDYRFEVAGTKICHNLKFDNDYCHECGEPGKDHGWTLYDEFEDHEIHRRESLWKWKHELGSQWEAKGLYNNVATGASVTGFTRAHLLRAAHTIGIEHIIYCDTDSLFCDSSSDISKLPQTDALGDWELEDRAPIGYFAGKKLYGIKTSKGKPKIASKGSRLSNKLITKIIDGEEIRYIEDDQDLAFEKIKSIAAGETVQWINHAPTFSIDGTAKFIHRNIRATARLTTT